MKRKYYIEVLGTSKIQRASFPIGEMTEKQATKKALEVAKDLRADQKSKGNSVGLIRVNICLDEECFEEVLCIHSYTSSYSIYDYRKEEIVYDSIQAESEKREAKAKAEKKKRLIYNITEVAERKGWKVSVSDRFNEKDSMDFEFSRYSTFGQDFIVPAIMTDMNPQTLIDDLRSGYEAFDVDEEASHWIGSDGHGKNGAPYHITDIVKDMKECEEMYGELSDLFDKEAEFLNQMAL